MAASSRTYYFANAFKHVNVVYVCLIRNKAAAKIRIGRQGEQIQRQCEKVVSLSD